MEKELRLILSVGSNGSMRLHSSDGEEIDDIELLKIMLFRLHRPETIPTQSQPVCFSISFLPSSTSKPGSSTPLAEAALHFEQPLSVAQGPKTVSASKETKNTSRTPEEPGTVFSEAADFCREATRLVESDRRPQNADKMINFKTTALLWDAYLDCKKTARDHEMLTPHDVACMMELFKIGRRFIGSYNPDNYIDAAGYAGCAGELVNDQKR